MCKFNSMRTKLIPLLVGLGIPLLPLGDSRSALGSPSPDSGTRSQPEAIQNKRILPEGHVGAICVVGNEVTPDSIILDQLELYPGVRYLRKDLRNAQRKLARLGLFTTAYVRAQAELPDKPFKTIVVLMQERPDANLRLTLARFLCYLRGSQVDGPTAAHISDASRLLDRYFLFLQYRRVLQAPLQGRKWSGWESNPQASSSELERSTELPHRTMQYPGWESNPHPRGFKPRRSAHWRTWASLRSGGWDRTSVSWFRARCCYP
jgi:hypothetical protein